MEKDASQLLKYNILCKEKDSNFSKNLPSYDENSNKFSNTFIQRTIKTLNKKNKLNKTIKDSSLLTNKYINLMNLNKQNKYLNDNILDNLFSENHNEFIDKTNHTVIPHEIIKKSVLNNSNNKKKKNLFIKISDNPTINANINKNNRYNLFVKSLKINNTERIRRPSLKKSSMTAKLAFQLSDNLDVLDEHLNTTIKDYDKFAKFKLLLNKKQNENKRLINSIQENIMKNENMIKVFKSRIVSKHLGF